MIRLAKAGDIDKLVPMLREFYESADMSRIAPFNESHWRNLLNFLISSDQAQIIIATSYDCQCCCFERLLGCIGLIFTEWPMAPNVGMVAELFWWVDPKSRGTGVGRELLGAAEKAAEKSESRMFSMYALRGNSTVGSIYESRGFRPMETAYTKELG